MLLNSHISAYARCLAGKVCGLVRSTWGASQGEDKPGARDKILNPKVACRACAGQTFPHCLFFHLLPELTGCLAACRAQISFFAEDGPGSWC